MPPGDRRIVSDSTDRTPPRVGPSLTGWRFPVRARPLWLGPAVRLRDVSARRITLFTFAAATPINSALRLGVLTRDRPVLPKQSAEPGTAGGPFKAAPARSFPPRAGRACDAAIRGCFDRAPLLRFSSHSALTGRGRAVRRSRPANDPASAFGRSRPAHRPEPPDRLTPLRFSAGQNRCDGARIVADAGGRSVPVESLTRALAPLVLESARHGKG
jgi:hypothetical protein